MFHRRVSVANGAGAQREASGHPLQTKLQTPIWEYVIKMELEIILRLCTFGQFSETAIVNNLTEDEETAYHTNSHDK